MWEKIRIVFTIPELRKKIFFTLALLLVFRLGGHIWLPVTDRAAVAERMSDKSGLGLLLGQISTISASQLRQLTIFGLGIMPYISASIIFQLLGSVWAPLERLQKEGESGRKKINEYTRYATVIICLFQSWAFLGAFISGNMVDKHFLVDGHLSIWWQLLCVLTMTTGTVFLMWIGEQIDEFGIGNGISLLIMAGILANIPHALSTLFSSADLEIVAPEGKYSVVTLLILLLLFIGVIVGVVFITLGQRRIPTQSAKHVRGRRVFGGTRNYLPLRVNQAGVMPIIFASSLLLFPQMAFGWLHQKFPESAFLTTLSEAFPNTERSFVYYVCYIALIYFFCYFWTAITFNPKDMSENLKDMGAFIPGYRPGKRTADYLERVMVRITYVGAGFLAVVAITPTLVASAFKVDYSVASFFGGTGLLIAVSVAFDLVQKIDSHLVMRNYRGLLEK